MEIFVGILLLVVVIVGSLYIFFKYKRNKNNEYKEQKNNLVVNTKENTFPDIQIIENTTLVPSEKNKIIDSNIKGALSMLDNYVPKVNMINKNVKNSRELLNNNRAFFASAKKGTDKLLEVKESANEVYGIQMKEVKGTKGKKIFHKQTKFTKEDKLIKSCGKDALVNAGFNATSMIVGQYYMSEINDKLEKISNNINEISDFQDSEYQGKLLHIISKMEEILESQSEILSNEESRKNAYYDNKNLESKCAELLGQANTKISKELIDESLDYKKYENKVKIIEEWFLRQQLTQELLMKIGDLRYVLANGSETSKLSHKQYNNYLKQTNSINKKLENWHNTYIEKFGIDIDKQRKKGNLFKIREYTIGMINEDWNYNKLQNNVVQQITLQLQAKEFKPYENNKQNEKILIQKYKGEYYNLPDTND